MPNDLKFALVRLTKTDGTPWTVNGYCVAEMSDGCITVQAGRGQRDKACVWCSLMSNNEVRKIPVDGSVETLAGKFPQLAVLTKASGKGSVAINPQVLVEVGVGIYTDANGRELPCTWVVWAFGGYTRKTAVTEPYEEALARLGVRAA